MNKNVDCEVIRDLLPLYCDNVVSDKTKAVIEEHLADCEECKAEHNKLICELPVEDNSVNTQEKFVKTMKKQKKKSKIIIGICIALAVAFGALYVEHYYGDNIYGAFVFKDSKVVKVNDSTYKAPKDNFRAFDEYMINNGWYFKEQMGSMYIYENDEKYANCLLEFKEFYALYTVTYEDKIKPSSELINLYAKNIYDSSFKDGVITYSHEKSNWSVAWNNGKDAKITSAALIVEEKNENTLYKELKINGNADIHGWHNYVLAPQNFSAKCKNADETHAYTELLDSNGVVYRVCLDETGWNYDDPDDASNEIIITDKNGEYSYWKYLAEKNYK